MKKARIYSAMTAAAMLAATITIIPASAEKALEPTGETRKFQLGTTDYGGTGVENGGKNWVKVVQNSNNKRLFSNVAPGTDVAALQVTFDITDWSGKEFDVTWGANIDFIGDSGTTWCGTSAFAGISEYKIDGNGEYTVTCDLAKLAESKGKAGISYLQTCEMVIVGVEEGDTTMINVKKAVIYEPGDDVPSDGFTTDISDDDSGSGSGSQSGQPSDTQRLSKELNIDGDNANVAENMLYRGQGMISANNSSRLLLDYKTENPDKYWEIMNYLFGEDGLGMTHLKVEMGADINSSSGTEPAVKRSADEPADVTRGAAYQIAADAKSINPDLTLDMLWWSEPKWVSSASDVYAARYRWYKETLDAAYNTYGIKFDYVSAVQNERAYDADWIKYLAAHLDNETDAPYDYSQIKIVAGDEVCSWNICDEMMKDEELRNAIDVIGSHYTSWSSTNARKLANEYGKELWFSEASSPMTYSQGAAAYDGKGSGLADIGGTLDIANRIITMYPGGGMTLYEYQPAVAAYYDGVTYCRKQLIKADEPWSGAYEFDSGYYMGLHFSKFIKKGWAFVDGACYADGKAGGDGHAIVDAVYSYVTLTDTDTGDYSTVICNTTDKEITYNFNVTNLGKAAEKVYVWETRGSDGDNYDENYFKKINEITPAADNGKYTYSVTLKPYSLVTVSTLDVAEQQYSGSESGTLELPYSDDYEYEGYASDYLSSRGGAPRYTTDEGGAFEVVNVDGNNVVMQKITSANKANEWGSSPDPTTNFGDDRWFNYSVSADVNLEVSGDSSNYAGVGLRYRMGGNGKSGYWAKLNEDGKISLVRNSAEIVSAELENFDKSAWNNLKVEAVQNVIKVYVNGECVIEYVCTEDSLLGAGRAAYFSSYNNNCFDNFKAEVIDDIGAYVERFDDMDKLMSYSGSWNFTTTGSWKNFNRTNSKGSEGAIASFSFTGTGFTVFGDNNKGSELEITVDGTVVNDDFITVKSGSREVSYYKYGLEDGKHTVQIKVLSGSYNIDGVEIVNGNSISAEASGLDPDEDDNKPNDSKPDDNLQEGNEPGDNNSDDEAQGSDSNSQKDNENKTDDTVNDNPKTGAAMSSLAAASLFGLAAVVSKKKSNKE